MRSVIHTVTDILQDFGSLMLASVAASSVRAYYSSKKYTLQAYFASTIISVFVGVLAGKFFQDTGMGEYSLMAASVASLLSQDIIIALLKMGADFRENPFKFIKGVRRGNKEEDK